VITRGHISCGVHPRSLPGHLLAKAPAGRHRRDVTASTIIIMTQTMPSRYHSEPGYSQLMGCIRDVRLHGQKPSVACDKLKISTRTFRRYLAVSRTMTDSKFYIPMTPKEKAKLSKRLSKRALSEQSKSGNNRSNDGADGDDGDNGNDSGSSSGNGNDNGNGNSNGSGSSRSTGSSKGEKSGKSESKQLGRPAKKRVKLATKHKRAKSLDPRIVDASNMFVNFATGDATGKYLDQSFQRHKNSLGAGRSSSLQRHMSAPSIRSSSQSPSSKFLLLGDDAADDSAAGDAARNQKVMRWTAPGWGSTRTAGIDVSNSQEAEQTGVDDADDCDMDLDTADFGDDSMLDSGDDENDEVNGHRRRSHGVPSTGPRLPSAAMSPPRTGGHNSRQQAALLAKRRRRQAAKARISPDMLKRAHSGILVTPDYLHKQSSSSDLLQGLTSAERAQLRNTSSRVMQQKRTAARAVGTRPFPTRDSPLGQSKRAHIVSAPVQLRSQQRAAAGIVPGVVGCSDSSPTAVSAAGQAAIIHDLQKIKSELAYLQFLQCQSLQGSLTREQAQEFTANSAKARQLQHKQEAMQSARNAKLSERGASAGPSPILWGRHAGSVNAIVALQDGTTVATAGSDRLIRLWRSGVCLAVLAGHNDKVLCLLPFGEGRLLSGSADGTVKLWKVDPSQPGRGSCVLTFSGHVGAVHDLARLSDVYFVSGGDDGILRIWSLRAPRDPCLVVPPHSIAPGTIRSVACLSASRSRWIVASSEDTTIHFWSVEATQTQRHGGSRATKRESTDSQAGAMSPPPPKDASHESLPSKTTKGWHDAVASARLLRSLPDAHGRQADVQCLIALSDGTALSAGHDATVKRWDRRRTDCIAHASAGTKFEQVWSATTFKNGCWVAIASGTTPSVSIRGTDTLEELLSLDFSMHTDQRIMCVASLSDNRLVVGCQDGQLLTVAVDAYVV